MGMPWLDKPVMLHSSRASSCKLTPAQCAYRNWYWRNWYVADWAYALSTIYFLSVVAGVFVIVQFLRTHAPKAFKESRPWRKFEAGLRFIAYRGFQLPVLRYWSPSLGIGLVLMAGVTFLFALALGPRPYYWPEEGIVSYGNSPPIATRTGWMALALLPFGVILSAKMNLVSMLTGISHAKLQIFHQWIGYAMFVLGLIHTFPFIVYNIKMGDMVKQWYSSVTYWTGVVTLVFQAYLTFMSIPCIRNRFYEFFKATHFLSALLFTIFFFFHCDFRLSSWDYFIAAASFYFFCLFAANVRTFLIHGVHYATLDVLPCGFLRIRIPTIIHWTPGQHVFLRFLTLDIHALFSHPFTICSLHHDPEKVGRAPELVFYIKPKKGTTARLARLATKHPGLTKRVLIEGPYGGFQSEFAPRAPVPNTTRMDRFDKILVVTGGSGGGFSLPIIEEALRHRQLIKFSGNAGEEEKLYLPCRDLQIIFATRSPAVAEWYVDQIDSLLSAYAGLGQSSASIYVTSNEDPNCTPQSQSNHLSLTLDAETNHSLSEIADNKRDPNNNDVDADAVADADADAIDDNSNSNANSCCNNNINTNENTNTNTSSTSSLEKEKLTNNKIFNNNNNNNQIPAATNNNNTTIRIHKPTRPSLPDYVAAATQGANGGSGGGGESGQRVGIFVCGPASMLHDVRNSAANAQLVVMRSDGRNGVKEVYLHSEPFSW